MQNFNIIKKSEISKSFRAKKIMNDFDIQFNESVESFSFDFEFPKEWNIGLIVGRSGTGKTTIMNELFEKENIITNFKYTGLSVIDDMPKVTIDEIVKMFYTVGFGSVPNWLKPYSVLSNGEKMRVDLARALLEKDFVVFDEFTSVVDRNVAENLSIAINKSIKRLSKKFVAVTCHYDVENYLQPDWVLNTDTMQISFQKAHDKKKDFISNVVGMKNGEILNVIII